MSPSRRPSSVTGLQRAVTPSPDTRTVEPTTADVQPAVTPSKPVRVTLNFPPDLFRQLDHWTRDAADATDRPRVSIQDAVRAMIQAITSGHAPDAERYVLDQLRR